MGKIIKTISISQECAAVIEKQPNQSSAIEKAIMAMYGPKLNDEWIAPQDNAASINTSNRFIVDLTAVESTVKAYHTQGVLFPVRADKLLRELRAIGDVPTPFFFRGKIDLKAGEKYDDNMSQLKLFLTAIITGKKEIKWEDYFKE